MFRRLVDRAGVPAIRPHDTRHTWVSLALAAGVDMFVVSKRCGHATIDQTIRVYGHLMPDHDSRAAVLFEDYLAAAVA